MLSLKNINQLSNIVCVAFLYLFAYSASANNFNPPDLTSTEYNSSNTFPNGQCTWYVYGRVKEVHGIDLAFNVNQGRDAHKWYSLLDSSYTRQSKPVSGAIAIWKHKTLDLGHVAYVEHVYSNEVFYTEANFSTYNISGGGYDGYIKHENRKSFEGNKGGQNKWSFVGYVVPDDVGLNIANACAQMGTIVQPSNAKPPCPYKYDSNYIKECFSLPRAGRTTKSFKIYSTPLSSTPIHIIPSGITIHAVARNLFVAPCPLKVRSARNYLTILPGPPGFKKNTFNPGDNIFLISQIGEGASMYWYKGSLVQGEDSVCDVVKYRSLDCWAAPMISCARGDFNELLLSEEWIKVRTSSGQEGWVKFSSAAIDFPEKC